MTSPPGGGSPALINPLRAPNVLCRLIPKQPDPGAADAGLQDTDFRSGRPLKATILSILVINWK
jgi:hypothetical protein